MPVHSNHGFTIVELLVVIVVIAILAATSVLGYSGIRNRAMDAQKATIAKTVEKSLESYFATNDRYPGSDEMTSETDLQQFGLHQTDVVPPGCIVSQGIPLGWGNANTCGLVYIAAPNPNGSGFQCMKPTICRYYWLSYWSKTENKLVTIRHGQ